MSLTLPPRSDALSRLGRAAHDLGMAGMFGGQLFGRCALHPAVTEISDRGERGAVVNRAWRRYEAVNGLGLLAVAVGWGAARRGEARDRLLTPRERRLARAKDVLVAGTLVAGAANAVEGVRFARDAPGGRVPLLDGDHAAPEAPEAAIARKRRLNAFGLAAIGLEAGLVIANAALAQAGFRSAPLRRRLRRGG